MRCSSASGVCCTICGARWISTASCWTSWCRIGGTAPLPSVSSCTCCMGLQYKPRRLVTDGLRSYGVARRAILPDVRHRTSRYLNNRAEIFSSTNAPTRAADAEVQVRWPGTANSVGARHDLRSFPTAPPSHERSRISTCSRKSLPDLATGDLRPPGSMTRRCRWPMPTHVCHLVNLAMPSGSMKPPSTSGRRRRGRRWRGITPLGRRRSPLARSGTPWRERVDSRLQP